jgi:hypothetical protein
MNSILKLKDILNLSDDELKNTKIKFNSWNGELDPIEEYKQNPDKVNTRWLFWRGDKRNFNVGQIAICLVQIPNMEDSWLLTSIQLVTKELNKSFGINYLGSEIDKYKSLFGRVIIKFHRTGQYQTRYLNDDFEVCQILPSVFDDDNFPGYDNVRLSYAKLKFIIDRQKQDWINALQNQKAVYLITDTKTGKFYVGSATGENGMLLQRWAAYVNNGHGGNKDLRKFEFDYIKKYFQYSILENYNAKVDKHIILQRESWWKETLKTREFGYNAN